MKTYQVWSELHPMELVEAVNSFTARKLYAVRHRLPVHDCMSRAKPNLPEISASGLELYAINTGEFYPTHKAIADQGIDTWINHLRSTVVPLYCREISPVGASGERLAEVAAKLKAYYVQHLKEF